MISVLKKLTSIVFYFLVAILQSYTCQDYNMGDLLVGDSIWVNPYQAFSTPKNKNGQDVLSQDFSKLTPGTHSELLSFPTRSTDDCIVGDLTPIDIKEQKYLLANLCKDVLIVYTVDLQKKSKLVLEKQITDITSFTCSRIGYKEQKVYIICNKDGESSKNLKIVKVSLTNQQIQVHTLTLSTEYSLYNVLFMNLPVTGGTKTTMVLYQGVQAKSLVESNHTNTTVSNYKIILWDLSSSSVTERNLSIANKTKMIGLYAHKTDLYMLHYSNLSKKIEPAKCSFSSNWVIGNCTAYKVKKNITVGFAALGLNNSLNDGTFYYFDGTANKTGACVFNFKASFSTEILTTCPETSPPVENSTKPWNITKPTHGYAIVAYMSDNTTVLDFVSRPKGDTQPVVFRRRLPTAKFVFGYGSYGIVYANTSLRVISGDSHSDALQVALTEKGEYSQRLDFNTLTTEAAPTNKNLMVKAKVIDLMDNVEITDFGTTTLKGSTGYYQRLPFSRKLVEGNALTATNSTSAGDVITAFDNIVELSDEVKKVMQVDQIYLAGDSAVGVQLNNSNQTMLRYFACNETLGNKIATTCVPYAELPINGEAKWKYLRYVGIQEKTIKPTDPEFKIVDKVVSVHSVDDYVIVEMQDDSSKKASSIGIFPKRSRLAKYYNFTKTAIKMNILDFRKDLFVSFIEPGEKTIAVYEAKRFNLSSIKQVYQFKQKIDGADPCIRGAGLFIKSTPRLRFVSRCENGKEYALEREFLQTRHRGLQQLFFKLYQAGNSSAGEINACIIDNFYVYWETSKNILHGVAGHKTDRFSTTIPGVTQFKKVHCLSNSSYVLIEALDSGSKLSLFVYSVRSLKGTKRLPFILDLGTKVTDLTPCWQGNRQIHLTYKEDDKQVFRKLFLSGPIVFSRSSTDNSDVTTSLEVKNSQKTVKREIKTHYSQINHTVSVSRVNKIPIKKGEFNLETLFKITGPIFSIFSKNNNEAKSIITPRVYHDQTITRNFSYSIYKVKWEIGARIESDGVHSNLLVFKDPLTLRTNLSLNVFAEDTIAIKMTPDRKKAYTIFEGLNSFDRSVFVVQTSLVPTSTEIKTGHVPADIVSTQLKIATIDTSKNYFLVNQFNQDTGDMVLSIVDFSNLGEKWPKLKVLKQKRLKDSKNS